MSIDVRSRGEQPFFWLVWSGGLVCLMFAPLVWWRGPFVSSAAQMSWVLLLPALVFSLGLFGGGIVLLFRGVESPVISGYEIASELRTLRRNGAQALHFVPLLGVFWICFSLPEYLFFQKGIEHPLVSLLCASFLFSFFSLWGGRDGSAGFGIVGLVASLLMLGVGVWVGWELPSLGRLCVDGGFVSFVLLASVVYLGNCIKWWFGRTGYRRSFAQSFLGVVLVLCLGLGNMLIWGRGALQGRGFSVVLLLSFLWVSWLGGRSLWGCWRIFRGVERPDFPGQLASLCVGALPSALLLGWGVWAWLGRQEGQGATPENVWVFFSLVAIHFLGVSGLSNLHAVYVEEIEHHLRVWLFFRPVLLYLLVFFPFGFPGMILLKSAIF